MRDDAPTSGRGERGFLWRRAGNVYVVEWPGVLKATIGANGSIEELEPSPGAPSGAVEKISCGALKAFAHGAAGGISLHASAASSDNSAWLFLGESGAGKSTLASNVCTAHGFKLLTDDVLPLVKIDGLWHASPTESMVWLHSGAADGSKTSHGCPAAAHSAPISTIISLRFDAASDSVQFSRIHGVAAAAHILASVLRFDPTPTLMTREVELAASLVEQAAVWVISRSAVVPAIAVSTVIGRLAERSSA